MNDESPKPVSSTVPRMSLKEVALRLSLGALVGICVGALLAGICCSLIGILFIKGELSLSHWVLSWQGDLSAGVVWGFKQGLILAILPGGILGALRS